MRPLKLYIEGLQSFIKGEEIDFEALSVCGLFGIFGSTGSGKSTVLDAIMISLYGDAGKKRDQKDFINITVNKAYIRFVFEAGKEIYTVERTFRIRKGGSMDNSAVLFKKTSEGELTIADNIKNTDKEIENIIGLSADEFKKCVILPQGEFASFIKAQRGDRLKIIGSLFNLEQYGDSLFDKIASRKYNAENKQDNLKSAIDAIGDFDYSEIETLEKKIENEKATNEKTVKEIKFLREQIKETEKDIETKKEYDKAKEVLDKLNLKKSEIEETKKQAEILKKALVLLPLITEYKKLENELLDFDFNLNKFTKEANDCIALYNNDLTAKEKAEADFLSKGQELSGKVFTLSAIKPEAVALKEKNEKRDSLVLSYKELNKNLVTVIKEKENAEIMLNIIKKSIEEIESRNDIEMLINKSFIKGGIEEIEKAIDYLSQDYKGSIPHFLKVKNEKEIILNTKFNDIKNNDYKDDFVKLKQLKSEMILFEKKISDNARDEGVLNTKIAQVVESGNIIKKEISILTEKFSQYGFTGEIFENDLDRQIELYKKEYKILEENKVKAEKALEIIRENLNKANMETGKFSALKIEGEKQLNFKKEILENELKISGFLDIENVLNLKAQKSVIEELDFKIKEYEEKFSLANNNFSILKEKAQNIKADQSKFDILMQNLKNLELQNNQLIENIAVNGKSLQIFKENKIKLENYKSEMVIVKKLLGELSILYGLVKGKNFMEYVAEEFIQEITMSASRHTAHLTGGRFSLLYKDGVFLVEDNYSGGELRSVNTLSGGETFLVSLSLAVALSEAIVKMSDKPIEFFFLDEGFGTLDRELCDIVMTTLEKLRQTHFTIGIISHVPELMQRLPCKLLITPPNENSGSTVRHVY